MSPVVLLLPIVTILGHCCLCLPAQNVLYFASSSTTLGNDDYEPAPAWSLLPPKSGWAVYVDDSGQSAGVEPAPTIASSMLGSAPDLRKRPPGQSARKDKLMSLLSPSHSHLDSTVSSPVPVLHRSSASFSSMSSPGPTAASAFVLPDDPDVRGLMRDPAAPVRGPPQRASSSVLLLDGQDHTHQRQDSVASLVGPDVVVNADVVASASIAQEAASDTEGSAAGGLVNGESARPRTATETHTSTTASTAPPHRKRSSVSEGPVVGHVVIVPPVIEKPFILPSHNGHIVSFMPLSQRVCRWLESCTVCVVCRSLLRSQPPAQQLWSRSQHLWCMWLCRPTPCMPAKAAPAHHLPAVARPAAVLRAPPQHQPPVHNCSPWQLRTPALPCPLVQSARHHSRRCLRGRAPKYRPVGAPSCCLRAVSNS